MQDWTLFQVCAAMSPLCPLFISCNMYEVRNRLPKVDRTCYNSYNSEFI